ncbi:UNVERIFIED_CONTAM: putative LRR receptor-like serine/threonine-protein kinase [Sesamum radiatum]|uniref:LRR receptor-like serine/threonine-protein kinase n=1 Tax=Sesamum radiatum TaxID=300843 RepID=A0AAW2TKX5_SESRA
MSLISCNCLVPLLFLAFFFTLSLSFEARNPEVEALIGIREGLDDPHGALSNWDEDSVDPCSWSMITCNSDNLVTALGAPSQGLSGSLSWMIANLTNLKQVLLQNNNISGQIPTEIGYLPNLQTLDLSNNKLSGHIPESLGFLNRLQYLRLNNNSLSGAVPLSLASLPQLTFLFSRRGSYKIRKPQKLHRKRLTDNMLQTTSAQRTYLVLGIWQCLPGEIGRRHTCCSEATKGFNRNNRDITVQNGTRDDQPRSSPEFASHYWLLCHPQ